MLFMIVATGIYHYDPPPANLPPVPNNPSYHAPAPDGAAIARALKPRTDAILSHHRHQLEKTK